MQIIPNKVRNLAFKTFSKIEMPITKPCNNNITQWLKYYESIFHSF